MVYTYYEEGRMIVEEEQQGMNLLNMANILLKNYPKDWQRTLAVDFQLIP